MGVGRFHLIGTYGRAILSGAHPTTPAIQYILGQGDGSAGFSPPTTLILRRAYMDTMHVLVNAANSRSVEFVVYKNGANSNAGGHAAAATVGTVLYDLNLLVDVAGAEQAEDTTSHVILPTDYICAAVGHDIEQGPGTGALTTGSLDSTFILEGEFDHSSGGGIDEDGRMVVHSLHGFNNSVVSLFLMGQSTGTNGWSPATPIRLKRLHLNLRVSVPSASATIRYAVYKNGIGGGNLLAEIAYVPDTLTTITRNEALDEMILTTDEVFLVFEQTTGGGGPPGTASVIELSVLLEGEYV